jgi:transposase InsO family protein
MVKEEQPALHEELEKLRIEIVDPGQVNELRVTYDLEERIRTAQKSSAEIKVLRELMKEGKAEDYCIDEQGTVWLEEQLCVPQGEALLEQIMKEAHDSTYSIHPGNTKMYKDLKTRDLWKDMRRDIAHYVAYCDTCSRVKIEHQKPAGLLKPLEIPVWKWEDISMDFVVGLPWTPKGNESVWVIVDRLTKVAHFVPVKARYATEKMADLYVEHILRLHGAPRNIMSDRGPQFVAKFWKSFHQLLGTTLSYSTAFHPQTDGQTERVNQVLEKMLRACALTYGTDWESSLPFVEFSYNNNFQASLRMAPFEALDGRKCRTPLAWSEVGEWTLFGPAIIEEAEEKVEKVRENLRIAQSRQKSYADKRRRELTFAIGDRVYLKVSPPRGTKRFLVKGKLAPRYVGPYQITKRIGSLAYQLALLETMAGVHLVFHVSHLKKSEKVVEAKQVPRELLDLQDTLEYAEYPEKILDRAVKETRRTTIPFCKVLWSNHTEREATLEKEVDLRMEYPHLFTEEVGV